MRPLLVSRIVQRLHAIISFLSEHGLLSEGNYMVPEVIDVGHTLQEDMKDEYMKDG